jgi:hypothetical protein
MKKHIPLYKLFFTTALLLAAVSTFATGEDGEKQKTYSKSYPVKPGERISLNNQFGEVKITTWDKQEVKVDVTITTRATSDEKAQSILDGITIQDGRDNEGVYFKTNMEKNNNKTEWKGDKDKDKDKDKRDAREDRKGRNEGHNEGMEINYTVTMPAGNPLNLTNQFGKSLVPDLSGPVTITQKFGDLIAGNLSNLKELHVEFGTATVESISNGRIDVKFSKATIKKLNGTIKSSFEFCDNIKLPLDNSVTDFNLNNSYSNIIVTVNASFSGDFDIYTNFGDFKNSTSLPIKEHKDDDEHGPKFDKSFSGKSGSGACKVKMKSSFGNIKFI